MYDRIDIPIGTGAIQKDNHKVQSDLAASVQVGAGAE